MDPQVFSPDPFGRVDVFTTDDLFRFVPSAGVRRLPSFITLVSDALRAPDGSVVVAHQMGASRILPDDTVEVLIPFEGDGTTSVSTGWDVATAPDGTVYLSDLLGVLFQRDPGGLVTVVPGIDWPTEVAVGPDGSLWWTQFGALVWRMAPGGSPGVVYDGTGGGAGPVVQLPTELRVDAAGDAWLTDSFTNQLVRITPAGAAEVMASGVGTGTGAPLHKPGLIRAASDGSVWLHAGDDRIFRIDAAGDVAIVLERSGDGAHSFSGSVDLAVDAAGNAFVSGEGSHNVFRIAPDGTLARLMDASGDGTSPLERPLRVAADGAGGAFVGDVRGRVFHVDAAAVASLLVDGSHPLLFGLPIRGLAADGAGNLYFVESNQILRRDPAGVVTAFHSSPSGSVDSLTTDAAGNVYYADRFGDAVWRVAPDGTRTQMMNASGDGLGHPLDEPQELTFDAAGNLYATSVANDSVFVRTPAGVVSRLLAGEVDHPRGLAVDASGSLFVSGLLSDDVIRRTAGGAVSEVLAQQGIGGGARMLGPTGLALGENGDVFVTSTDSRNVLRLTPDGTLTEVIGPAGAGPGSELLRPLGVHGGPSGVIHVMGQDGLVLRLDLRDECDDGIDNDGDGSIDADDASCGVGPGERDPLLACDDGLDNDGDGLVDAADPFCAQWQGNAEAPQCSDGIDNDGDGGIDWDGAGVGNSDLQCRQAGQFQENPPSSCGFGFEALLPLAAWWGLRRASARTRRASTPSPARTPS